MVHPSDLDNLILEKVFKKHIQNLNEFAMHDGPISLEPFSTDSESARLVWQEMERRGGDTHSRFLEAMPSFRAQKVVFGQPVRFSWEIVPPKEICLAALKALEAN